MTQNTKGKQMSDVLVTTFQQVQADTDMANVALIEDDVTDGLALLE
jgi:hypothetical protein